MSDRGRTVGWSLAGVVGSALVLALIQLGTLLTGFAPAWAVWIFAGTLTVHVVAFMVLGVARRGGTGRLALPLGGLALLLLAGFSLLLGMPPPSPEDPVLWLGLPPPAAVTVYGIGVLPLLLVPLAYAWTFPELGLAPGDVDRTVARARALREADGARDGGGGAEDRGDGGGDGGAADRRGRE